MDGKGTSREAHTVHRLPVSIEKFPVKFIPNPKLMKYPEKVYKYERCCMQNIS